MNRRTRHHVDPFQCRIALTLDDWQKRYRSHGGPIGLDIGCGKGVFVSQMARARPDWFFIGVEIRDQIADKHFGDYAEIENLCLLTGNISLSLPGMFHPGQVSEVYFNFPDPYSKKRRHRKRRMVNAELLKNLLVVLEPSARIFFQTDDGDLFNDLHPLFGNVFASETKPDQARKAGNPLGIRSAWEAECEQMGRGIWRMVYCNQ